MNYEVAVRALCEFAAKQGDLDLRFTPSPTALEGIEGHQLVTARRGPGYRTEVTLSATHGPLRVRGRADGYDPAINQLEEIKTHRGDLARVPDNHRHLHWAQARVYGHMLCQELGLQELNLALVYFDIGRQTETVLRETRGAAELAAIFAGLCERFVAWAAQEAAHRARRDEALAGLTFPHADFRPGQRALAQAVWQANASRRCLLAQAPTGIGKTVGSLFPALKSMPAQRLDKVFYLAAKTPGRALALDAAALLRTQGGLPLRVLELTAREKACEHPGKACHGEDCPLAKGFYDRLPAARTEAAATPQLDRAALRALALRHEVCPYYLASEMARWADVVVGDYNYYFDGGAMLFGLTLLYGWRVSVLADEAHNLVGRARSMYTASLDRAALRAARAAAPTPLRKPLDRVGRAWPKPAASYEVLAELPDKFISELQGAASALTDHLAEHAGALEPDLQRFYFDALHFVRLAEQFGSHSLFDLSTRGRDVTACIRNVVPAHFLAARFALAHSCTLFSATLSPWNYHTDTLGMPADTAWVDVESPFDARQLAVHVVRSISTRYQHRARSVAPIAQLVARQYAAAPGNYLAFFSSFDYLEQVADAFAAQFPMVPCWRQQRRMDEAERTAFLDRFEAGGRGVGFAVLGGSFGEGIDLPGDRLVGAFIATLGLPQVNPVNEQLRARMDALFGGAGYDYTYLYPGMQKVVQAAGRVIRTQTDRGVVYLIDDRFGQPEVRSLLPRWWAVGDAAQAAEEATTTG
ncbi:MAG: ATP-dependent DNA helicase [Telluria sp.]